MNNSYVIINDNHENVLKIRSLCDDFQNLHLLAVASGFDDGIDVILEMQPSLIFLEIDPENVESKLSLSLISELYRYLKIVPKIIVTAKDESLAYQAIKYGVFDYLPAPFRASDFRKAMLRFEKSFDEITTFPSKEIGNEVAEKETTKTQKPLTLCIKSYGDYRFIDASDVIYFQADNNSTDIHLASGEMITAFKTLKHFEKILPSEFFRIHNSYIVNMNFISRIHTGNSVCYIKNSATKIPFSKSYKSNIDKIIAVISDSDYLEI